MGQPSRLELSDLPQADQDAIAATLGSLLSGFSERDADALNGIYCDDVDWVNAFGTELHGSQKVVDYLRGLFADSNFTADKLAGPPEVAFKVLTDEVVLVSAHLRVEGQKLAGGGQIELRDNFSLRVLQRQGDGQWLIASEMYNDANTEVTHEH